MEKKLPLTKEQRAFIEEKNKKVLDWRKVFSQQPLAEPLKSIANGLRQAQADSEGCSGHECFFRRTGVLCNRCK